MFLCYMDESGTPEIPGNTSHYILVGLVVPITKWKNCDIGIRFIRQKYGLEQGEIHTGWLLRSYEEQNKTPNFSSMTYAERRQSVEKYRNLKLLSRNDSD